MMPLIMKLIAVILVIAVIGVSIIGGILEILWPWIKVIFFFYIIYYLFTRLITYFVFSK